MKQAKIILLFLFLSSNILGQIPAPNHFSKVDSLIKANELTTARTLISELSNPDLTAVSKFELNEYLIRINQKEEKKSDAVKLMVDYVQDLSLDAAFTTMDKSPVQWRRSDTIRVYTNKSYYSKKLFTHYLEQKDYSLALEYLNIHESKYLSMHKCGNGAATDNVKRKIVRSKIDQFYGKHDSVLVTLLPLKFNALMQLVVGQQIYEAIIDSMLVVSIKANYSPEAIKKEFKNCLANIPTNNKSSSNDRTKIKLFGVEMTTFSIDFQAQRSARRKEVYKIKDQDERQKVQQQIFEKTYLDFITNMAIYKQLVATKE